MAGKNNTVAATVNKMSLEKLKEGTDVTVEGIIKSLTPVKTSQAGNKYYNFTLVQRRPQLTSLNNAFRTRSPAVWERVLMNKMAALHK